MNQDQMYRHLLEQGYTPEEAEEMVDEEMDYERRAENEPY